MSHKMAEKIGIFLDIFVHSFRSEYGGRFVDTPNESPGSQLSYAVSTNLLRCSVPEKISDVPTKVRNGNTGKHENKGILVSSQL